MPGAVVRKWPIACVSAMAEKVKYAQLIGRPTYPDEWHAIDRMEGGGAATGGSSGRTTGGTNDGGTPKGSQKDNHRGNNYNPYDPRNQPDRGTSHVHPIIAKCLDPLWKLHGPQVSVKRILLAGNKTWDNLPYLHSMVNGRQNLLCYNYICGCCGFGDRCSFNHVPGTELVDAFAREVVQALEPGMKYMLKQSPAPDKAGSGNDANAQGKGRGFSGSPNLGSKRRRGNN